MELDDQQLVQACKLALPYDTTAFEGLLRRYEPIVFRTCSRYLGNAEDAEEACQDAFLRVFRGLPRFEQRSTFRTWLFRIVANVCATRWEKINKQSGEQIEFSPNVEDDRPTPSETDTDGLSSVGGKIGEQLECLAAGDRQILILRHVAELSFQELADALGVGLSTAKMRLYRAEQRLRAIDEEPPKP